MRPALFVAATREEATPAQGARGSVGRNHPETALPPLPTSAAAKPPAVSTASVSSRGSEATDRLRALRNNVVGLGAKRLALLGGAFALVLGATLVGASMLGPAARETIYSGLDRRDAAAITRELTTLDIPHVVGGEGTAVAVPVGRAEEARLALARAGLPASEGAGYELFDQVGSIGLTSFMQEVTRLRALEGEIARSIRSIEGVTAARVHLVTADPGSFRRAKREPSASIVISTRSDAARASAPAIRYLVAAAVPGLSVGSVTVLDDRGALLAAGDDMEANGLNGSLRLVDQLERGVEEKVARALEPFLGGGVRVSAKARIDTDREEVRETTFDPDGRVEREVRIEREERRSSSREADEAATVEQDLPDTGDISGAGGEASSEEDERRTETTSYEINTRTTSRVREAYRVDRLTVAVVVDRERLLGLAGIDPAADAAAPDGELADAELAEAIARVRRLAQSAAGMDEARGDVIEVTAVDFVEGAAVDATGGSPWAARMDRLAGPLIVALAFVFGLAILAFGLRPVIARLLERPDAATPSSGEWGAPPAMDAGDFEAALASGVPPLSGDAIALPLANPADRLSRLVELDEERTALVLRRWINMETAR